MRRPHRPHSAPAPAAARPAAQPRRLPHRGIAAAGRSRCRSRPGGAESRARRDAPARASPGRQPGCAKVNGARQSGATGSGATGSHTGEERHRGEGDSGMLALGITEHRGPPAPRGLGWGRLGMGPITAGTPGVGIAEIGTARTRGQPGTCGDRDSWEHGPGPAWAASAQPLAPSLGSGLPWAQQPHSQYFESPRGSHRGSPLTESPHSHRASWVLTMAVAWLITWVLLLAAGVAAVVQGTLLAQLSPGGTLQQGRDPLHSPAWGQPWPGLVPTWEASGEPSGAGDPGSEHWGGGSPVRWAPPLQAEDAIVAPLEMETTMAGAGTGAWQDSSTAMAMAEEPLVAWRGHEAEDQDSHKGGTWLPHGSVLGTPGPKVPTHMGLGSSGPPWAGQGPSPAGQSAAGPVSTPGPWPTVSTIALTPMSAVGTGTGTADGLAEGQPVARGPTAAPGLTQGTPLTPASSQLALLGTVPVPHPTRMGPAQGPHTSPGSMEPVGRQGALGGPLSPFPALPSSAPQLLPSAPSWGLSEPWTRVLQTHQRSTRRAPLSRATASPGDTAPRTDAGLTGQQGSQPTRRAALSTSPVQPPASSTAPPSTPGTGRSWHGVGNPSEGTEPLWVPGSGSALSRRAAA